MTGRGRVYSSKEPGFNRSGWEASPTVGGRDGLYDRDARSVTGNGWIAMSVYWFPLQSIKFRGNRGIHRIQGPSRHASNPGAIVACIESQGHRGIHRIQGVRTMPCPIRGFATETSTPERPAWQFSTLTLRHWRPPPTNLHALTTSARWRIPHADESCATMNPARRTNPPHAVESWAPMNPAHAVEYWAPTNTGRWRIPRANVSRVHDESCATTIPARRTNLHCAVESWAPTNRPRADPGIDWKFESWKTPGASRDSFLWHWRSELRTLMNHMQGGPPANPLIEQWLNELPDNFQCSNDLPDTWPSRHPDGSFVTFVTGTHRIESRAMWFPLHRADRAILKFGRSRPGSIVLKGKSRPGRIGQAMSETGTGTVLVSEWARSPLDIGQTKPRFTSGRAGHKANPGTDPTGLQCWPRRAKKGQEGPRYWEPRHQDLPILGNNKNRNNLRKLRC
jgi:hypothetical protein